MSGFIFEGVHVSEEQILKAATEIMAKNLDDDKDVCDGLACEDCAFRNKKYCLGFCIFYDRGEE